MPLQPAVLVTGGAGYIGAHAAFALAEAGFRPVVLDDLSYGHRRAVKWGPLVQGDIADRALVLEILRAHNIQAVMHFAALTLVGESGRDPGRYFRVNVGGTQALLDAMVEAGVKTLVFSSTCATYGLPEVVPIAETAPQRPINAYGATKLMIEQMLPWYAGAHGLAHASLRYFNAAGAAPAEGIGEDHTPETHLIPLVIDAALGRRDGVAIFGTDYPTPDGTAIRDYIHVRDLASAHVLALRHLLQGGDSLALNLGTGHGHSVREIVGAVERLSGRRVPVRLEPRRPGDPPALVADPAQAAARLGWRPERSDLDSILADAIAWATGPIMNRQDRLLPQPS